jgi:hypothetical protein
LLLLRLSQINVKIRTVVDTITICDHDIFCPQRQRRPHQTREHKPHASHLCDGYIIVSYIELSQLYKVKAHQLLAEKENPIQ